MTLEQLCQPLNSEPLTEELLESIPDLELRIETLTEKNEELESDLEDYKNEAINERQRAEDAFDAAEIIIAENSALEDYISYLQSFLEQHDCDYKEYEEYKKENRK